MKNSFALALVISLVCISTTQGCLTLYQDFGPAGNSFVMCKSGNIPAKWNDQVSAIVVPPGWRATLYQDFNNGGASLDIGEGTWSAPAAWNDQLSSLVIYPGCPVFYSDYGLSGSSFVMCQNGDVPSNFNDQVSSAYVPNGWRLTFYQNFGFGGSHINVNAGTWSAPAKWNDQLSSVRISRGCPVFYSDFNLGGTSFVMCNSGDVPASFNDQVSSILVPNGWRLTLYQDFGFGGSHTNINSGIWNAPTAWNDQLSSFRVIRRN